MTRKFVSIVALIATYLAVFLVVNSVHFQFFSVRVVLYDAMLDAVIAGIIVTPIGLLWARRLLPMTREEATLSLVVGFLLITLYALAFPTVIDRSLSVYILEKLDQRGGRISAASFDAILKQEYFPEYQLVDIRLTEQVNSGTIAIKNGCVTLTNWGATVIRFTRFYREHVLPKHREIMGRFTDELTHPFQNSAVVVPYKCE
jgi:hypothetical protein